MQTCKLYYGFAIITLVLLEGAQCAGPGSHHGDRPEKVDIPNRVAWLPEGTEMVLQFLIHVSDAMITQYSVALERIKTIRATWNSYPAGYKSIDLFYDNDIEHGSYQKHWKTGDYKPGSGDHAFRAAFETIQKFANKRVSPYVLD